MAYLASSKVKMYPSAYREASKDAESFFTSENNVTKSSTLGYYKDSFVKDDGTNLTIVIKGYRFEALRSDVIALASNYDTSIYAYIKLVNKGTGNTFKSLVTYDNDSTILDVDSNFKGLYFTNAEISDGVGIKVLEKVDNSWNVPSDSKIILTANQIKDSTSDSSIDVNFNTEAITTKSFSSPLQYGNFAICNTASNVAIKEISLPNFVEENGAEINVQFANTNTASNPTLKINSLTARPLNIFIGSGAIVGNTPYSSWMSGEVVKLVFSENLGAWFVSKPYVVYSSYITEEADKVHNKLTIALNGATSGTQYDGSEAKSYTWYAPTSVGTSGQVLTSSGSGAPTWEYQYNLGANKLISSIYPNGLSAGSATTPIYFSNGIPGSCEIKSGKTTLTTGTSAEAKAKIAYCDYYDGGTKVRTPVDIDQIPASATSTTYGWKAFSSTKIFYLTYKRNGDTLNITMNTPDSSIWYEEDVTVRFQLDALVKACMGNAWGIDSDNINYCSCVVTSGRKNVAGGDGIVYNTYIPVESGKSGYLYISRDSFGGGSSYGMSAEITLIIK